MKAATVTVSKLEAAERQLREAIRLFFDRRDPIAIHTLAGAASQILYDLAKHKGLVSYIRGNPLVRENMRGKWVAMLNEAQSFFKHADRNPDGIYEFPIHSTRAFLLEGVSLYEQLAGKLFWEAQVYSIWFALKHSDLLMQGAYRDTIGRFKVPGLDLEDFEMLSLILEQGPVHA